MTATSRWARWSDDIRLPPGGPFRFPLRWLVIGPVTLLPLVVPTLHGVFTADLPRGTTVVALLTVYSAGYLALPLMLARRGLGVRLGFGLAHLAVGFALVAVLGINTMHLLLYATVLIAMSLPTPLALTVLGVAVLALTGWLAALDLLVTEVGDLVTVVSVSTAMFFLGRLSRTVRQLRLARDEIAALAVSAERERLARDLHDLLGHSLTTIAVQAGLARRVLETSHDEARAIEEIRTVESLARGALADVRATVTDYREVSLAAELAGAREALRAADIRADLPHAVDDVDAELRPVFGHVVREAVTNVIRHAGASVVRIRLGERFVEITDDGTAEPGAEGNGLRGLSERLAQAGGRLRAGPRPGGGFSVRAEA
ncbi:sensor histidine kinase [Amycolatopsis suaedae]|uniref:sensor histidine kinase n=1 Tax=Amycolatopsis suaedae TaxID=2510978 RepID=UPI001F112206|nr:histidine kinase [Amycolatopsis suaedae]